MSHITHTHNHNIGGVKNHGVPQSIYKIVRGSKYLAPCSVLIVAVMISLRQSVRLIYLNLLAFQQLINF